MTSDLIDRRVRELADRQHGLVARRQLAAVGLSHTMVRHRVRRGSLEPISRRVLRIVGAMPTREQGLMAAVLHAPQPAALSHWTACERWGLPGFERRTIHVTAPHRRGDRARTIPILLHKPCRLLDHHVVEVDHIRVTTPTRTIFDMAGDPAVHPKRLERALDTAMAKSLVSGPSLERMLDDLAARGRNGIRLMRELMIERCGPDYRPPESNLESRFRELVDRAGLADFDRQIHVGSNEAWIGRVDFRHAHLPLIVEVDSFGHHSSLTDRRHDAERRAGLVAAGWTVVAVSDNELFHRPDEVIARVRTAIGALRRAA